MMWSSMTTTDNRFTDYGMGWEMMSYNGRFVVRHTGGQDETRTRLYHFPSEDLTVAVCCNYEQADTHLPLHYLANLLLDDPASAPWPYFASTVEEDWYRALRYSYDDGFAYYDYYRDLPTNDMAAYKDAFEYVNTLFELTQDGRHADAPAARVIVRARHCLESNLISLVYRRTVG